MRPLGMSMTAISRHAHDRALEHPLSDRLPRISARCAPMAEALAES
jgi:hypothetical protein